MTEANPETDKEEPGTERGATEHEHSRKVGFEEMDMKDLSQTSFESFGKSDLDDLDLCNLPRFGTIFGTIWRPCDLGLELVGLV